MFNQDQRPPQPPKLDDVLNDERLALGFDSTSEVAGLALSGGGIRSASFSLGVVQALGRAGILDRFHYLSTVSGGGYLGAAIQWLRSQHGRDWFRQLDHLRRGPNEVKGAEKQDFNWLDFIRHHGNYLQPGSISTLALVGIALRGAVVSVGLYFGLIVLVCMVPYALGVWCEGTATDAVAQAGQRRLAIAYSTIFSLLAIALNYSVATYVASLGLSMQRLLGAVWIAAVAILFGCLLSDAVNVPGVAGECWIARTCGLISMDGPAVRALRVPILVTLGVLLVTNVWLLSMALRASDSSWHYRARLRLQQSLGGVLALTLAVAAICTLPWLHGLFKGMGKMSIPAANLIGVAGAVYQAVLGRGKQTAASGVGGQVRVYATVIVLLLGLSLSAYVVAGVTYAALDAGDLSLAAFASACFVLLALLWLTNLNLFSLGRMYRDRLMEAFMPNSASVKSNRWGSADEADRDKPAKKTCPRDGMTPCRVPCGLLSCVWRQDLSRLYPIVNTNVVLADSPTDWYRGRAGDNFILTPRYCGSDATGWVKTTKFAHGDLTLATAMAVSAAAVNPEGAGDGRGIVRNRMVSFLMFLVQARLGCWFFNPKSINAGRSPPRTPNFLRPGIWGGLFARDLHEDAQFVELTDGGHFENIAAYELVRRRCKLIIIVSGGADPAYQMEDLGNLIEKVRVDFGVGFDFDETYGIDDLRPIIGSSADQPPFAKRGFAIAEILYPDKTCGWLLYLQATPVQGVTGDVLTYQRLHPNFPNETTANQFFDEAQVEAYRELGWQIASSALRSAKISGTPSGEQHAATLKESKDPIAGIAAILGKMAAESSAETQ